MNANDLYRCVIVLLPASTNSLGATCGQNSVALVEGDPRLLGAGRPEECLETFAHRAAGSTVVLHCPILHLLEEAKMILRLWPKEMRQDGWASNQVPSEITISDRVHAKPQASIYIKVCLWFSLIGRPSILAGTYTSHSFISFLLQLLNLFREE